MPVHPHSALSLTAALERREIGAESLLREILERIGAAEPQLHAFAHLDPGPAIERARALDAGAHAGAVHGLPLGVKDLIDTADLPTAYGSPIWAGHRPRADAAVVAACRAAGALIPGKTVTTEFAAFHPGPTRNPHDLSRTPGGSSSGSAAAVAAGLLPLALGTQTAASIIRPAAYCGIVGFKPTHGRVARAGIKLQSDTLDTIGGFARSVEDIALLASVLLDDPALHPARHAAPVAPEAGRMARWQGPHWGQVGADVQALWEQLGRVVPAVRAVPAGFGALTDLQVRVMQHEAARNLAWERQHHAPSLSPRLLHLLEAGEALDGPTHARDLESVRLARQAADALFEHHDLLLAPSAAGEAGPFEDGTGDPLFGRAWTLLGLPCLHLPLGRGARGLPIGLQLVGRAGDDARVLLAGAWLQGRWRLAD